MPTPSVLDIYHEDNVTSFSELAAAGIKAVIHKATEGTDITDPKYASRQPEAVAAGLLWGAYHFWRPEPLTVQAKNFLAVAKGAPLLAVDYEVSGSKLASLIDFIEQIEAATGRQMVIYGNAAILGAQLAEPTDGEADFLASRRLWWAEYAPSPHLAPKNWPVWLWQYSETGKIAGVSGDVDLNQFSGADLAAEWEKSA